MSRDVAHDEIYQSNGLNIPLRWTAPEVYYYNALLAIESAIWVIHTCISIVIREAIVGVSLNSLTCGLIYYTV